MSTLQTSYHISEIVVTEANQLANVKVGQSNSSKEFYYKNVSNSPECSLGSELGGTDVFAAVGCAVIDVEAPAAVGRLGDH